MALQVEKSAIEKKKNPKTDSGLLRSLSVQSEKNSPGR